MAYHRMTQWLGVCQTLPPCQTQMLRCCRLLQCHCCHIHRPMQPLHQLYLNRMFQRRPFSVTSIHPPTRKQPTLAMRTIPTEKRIKNSIQDIRCSDEILLIQVIIEQDKTTQNSCDRPKYFVTIILCVSFTKCFETFVFGIEILYSCYAFYIDYKIHLKMYSIFISSIDKNNS